MPGTRAPSTSRSSRSLVCHASSTLLASAPRCAIGAPDVAIQDSAKSSMNPREADVARSARVPVGWHLPADPHRAQVAHGRSARLQRAPPPRVAGPDIATSHTWRIDRFRTGAVIMTRVRVNLVLAAFIGVVLAPLPARADTLLMPWIGANTGIHNVSGIVALGASVGSKMGGRRGV